MIVCVDTNTLIQGRNPGHRCFPILEAIVFGRISWAVSNRILTEYQEVVSRTSGPGAWLDLARLMELIDLTSGNLIRISPHFQSPFSVPRDQRGSRRQRIHRLCDHGECRLRHHRGRTFLTAGECGIPPTTGDARCFYRETRRPR